MKETKEHEIKVIDKYLEKNNIQADKNILQNAHKFTIYGPESNVILDMLMFLIKKNNDDLTHKLFNEDYIEFDKKNFVDFSSRSKNSISDKLDFSKKDNETKKLFKNWCEANKLDYTNLDYLDYCLLKMLYIPLPLIKTGISHDGKNVIQFNKLEIVRQMEIVENGKKGRGHKRLYRVYLNDNIKVNNIAFYSLICDSYSHLDRSLRAFYLFLKNVEYNMVSQPNNDYEYNIETLGAFVVPDITVYTKKNENGKHNYRILKIKIKKAFEKISSKVELNIDLDWDTYGKSKYCYKPIFSLLENIKIDYNKVNNKNFEAYLFKTLYSLFLNSEYKNDITMFIDKSWELVAETYSNCFEFFYRKRPNDLFVAIKQFREHYGDNFINYINNQNSK